MPQSHGHSLVIQFANFWVNFIEGYRFGGIWGLSPSVPQLGQDLDCEGLYPLLPEEGVVDLWAVLQAEAWPAHQEQNGKQIP